MPKPALKLFALLVCCFSVHVHVHADNANDVFDAAVETLSQAYFTHVPEAAVQLGLSDEQAAGSATRLMDRSPAGNRTRNQAFEAALADLKAIDPATISADRQVSYAALTVIIEGALAPSRVVDYGTTSGAWTVWYLPYPIVQNSGPTVDIPNFLASQQPVGNAQQAQDFLTKLRSVDERLDGALESLRQGVARGAIPPDFIIEKSLGVVDAFSEQAAAQNPIYVAFMEKAAAAELTDAQPLADEVLRVIETEVRPAYRRIANYLREIQPTAPHDAGLWRLPGGAELYAAMIRHMTDVNQDPATIHQTGLAEVTRIQNEMDQILRAEGYTEGTVGDRMQLLNVEPRFLYPNTPEGKQELLADVRGYVTEMDAELPNWFKTIPDHKVEVKAIPEFSQDSAPMGYYNAPTPDGSRPGYYFINLRDTALHPKWSLKTLTYHEAAPGHHLDGATSVDRAVPPLVKGLWSNTSGEGWALYSEQLASEMGMYADDPFGDLGRLQAELHRAVRLVTDTGMHAMKWSREKAIQYMIDAEGLDEATATSEIERFVVWPAQALGYKLGQLNLLALREEARTTLGDDFDIREFNQQLLNVASSPMPFIQATMRAWIAGEQAKS